MGFVTGQSRDQGSLFPVVLDDLVPQEHLVRVIDAFVSRLDLVGLGFGKAEPAATGRPPYDPGDLLKLYLYGYLNQVRSSRRLERECGRNVELMWLVNRLAPDFKTIAEFRRQNGGPLRAAGGAFVSFCREAGLLGAQWVAIDGSKFQAVASRKKAVTVKQLQRQQAGIEKRIAAYLEQLEAADRHEEQAEVAPDAETVRAALTQLRARVADLASAEALLKALGQSQHVVGEPDAKLMKTGEGAAKVAYNVQSAVDAKHQLIVAHEVTQELSDNRSLLPMAQQAKRNTGADTLKVVADAGYSNAEQAAQCESCAIVPYVPANRSTNNQDEGQYFDKSRFSYEPLSDRYRCPAGQWLTRKQIHRPQGVVLYTTAACGACALKARCTGAKQRIVSRLMEEAALERAQARVSAAPDAMALRRQTVEHPFGTLKYRIFSHGRFLLRGLRGAGAEMALAVLSYNLRRASNVLGLQNITSRLQATEG
jgi:transposase